NVKTIPRRVGFGAADSLDVILDPLGIPADFDLLSIDIDGNDYHAWSAVTIYHPKIVVVEFNPTIATGVEFVQERNPRVQQGSSISSINALAREKQYELVAVTWNNAIFVASEYFPAFEIADNSIHALRDDSSGVTHFFYGYDGQVFLRGQRSMIWHGVPLSAAMAQQLPVSLRGSPEDFGPVRSTLLKVYRRLRCIAQRVPWGASPTRGSTPKP
ncbi:MAG TPA: hypothetical protein VG326_11555, partial [Tepidisphaeraceae bacterium]|nr:hypothetical protein [Tepidisphaeraceae bacterium]